MSSKHTPGPWKAHFEEAYYVTGPDLGRVAMMMNLKGAHGIGGRRTGDESAANCRLIAAAPEMLDLLNDINNWLVCHAIATPEDMAQSFLHFQQEAEKLIAKATGAAA